MTNTILKLFTVNSISNLTTNEKIISFRNIGYSDTDIPSDRDLISMDNIIGNTNLTIILEDFKFMNLTFPNGGKIINLNHQLMSEIKISNSTFKNITSGQIVIQGTSRTNSQSTSVTLQE